MKTHIETQDNSTIVIQDHISKAIPFVYKSMPFQGVKQVILEVENQKKMRGICFSPSEGKLESICPHYFSRFKDIPDTFFIVTLSAEGVTTYFCLNQGGLDISFKSNIDGHLILEITSEREHHTQELWPSLLILQGDDLHQTIALTLRYAKYLTGDIGRLVEEKGELPEWMYYLGWESGASFGKEVTHDKILSAVWGLRQLGFQPGYVVIDEGWRQESKEGSRSFSPDVTRFPEGLKGIVDELHRAGVQHVGVWHAMQAKEAHLGEDLGDSFEFFHQFYGYLKGQGISFVKVGKQNLVTDRNVYDNLQIAIQAAGSVYFEVPNLNTECLRGGHIFSWTTSQLASAGDNLDTQTTIGAKRAIRNLLTNSLWLEYLMHPDFNAWTTYQQQSESLAVLHALSGSLNVISDPPGNHNSSILKKLVLPSGRILKADRPLRLEKNSAFINPLEVAELFKAYTFKGSYGVMACFNLYRRPKTIHGAVKAHEVEGLEGERFAVFSLHHGFLGCYDRVDEIPVTLKPNQSEIITFAPVESGVALIGSYSFYLPPASITEVAVEDETMHISSLVTAPLIMYCERSVLEIRRNGVMIPWEYDHEKKVLTIDVRSTLSEIPASYTITFE